MNDFLIARNPSTRSALPFLLCLPLADGELWLKARETWPRASRVYCHPLEERPREPLEVLERVAVVSCVRRGPAIDLVLDRGINRRSQFVFTTSRGRPVILWQTPKAAMSAKPGLRIPRERSRQRDVFYIDTRERHGYTFRRHESRTERRALLVGDYAAILGERIIGVVERKTLQDFATSLVDASLAFEMAELAGLPHAAVAVEATYSALLRHAHVTAGLIPELIARLQIRYPHVAINFLEARSVAEEWTYRFLHETYANAERLPL